MTGLKIARGHEIDLTKPPFDTMGLRAFISGMSGAGKSYTEMKFLEEAYRSKMQFCLLDVHGEGHVLGELGDDVMIASDRFGIPVLIEAIPVYLDALQQGMSLVIDLKPLFFSDEGLGIFFEFMFEFLSKFLALWSKVMTPILISFDEAQEVMPQSPPKGIQKLFNKCKQLVLGGRKFGIHYLLASQRTALIDKTPISQANVRLFGKVEEETDYNAIKPHLKYTKDDKTYTFSFQEMKQLRSGEFVLSSEGEASKVKILSRRTTDAGATPTFVPTFTKSQKQSMDGIAERIQSLIVQAEEERKRKQEEESELARLRRRDEKKDEDIKELKQKLDMVELIQSKMGRSGQPSSQVDVEGIYEDVRKELAKEFSQKEKDLQSHIEELERDKKQLSAQNEVMMRNQEWTNKFRKSLADFIGTVPSSRVDTEAIVTEVLKRVPRSTGGGVSLAPLDALKETWHEQALGDMVERIDSLRNDSPKSIDLLILLIVQGEFVTRGSAAKAIIGSDSGSSYQRLNEIVAPLRNLDLIIENGRKEMKASLDSFIKRHVVGVSEEDIGPLQEHVLATIYRKRNGDTK